MSVDRELSQGLHTLEMVKQIHSDMSRMNEGMMEMNRQIGEGNGRLEMVSSAIKDNCDSIATVTRIAAEATRSAQAAQITADRANEGVARCEQAQEKQGDRLWTLAGKVAGILAVVSAVAYGATIIIPLVIK